MGYRVILSRPALRDLGEIARYIAQDNPTAACGGGWNQGQFLNSQRVTLRRVSAG